MKHSVLISIWVVAIAGCNNAANEPQNAGGTCPYVRLNECGVCGPPVGKIGASCLAANGCEGTRTCAGEGQRSECNTTLAPNECGICGGGAVAGVGVSCTAGDGQSGFSVCNDAGDGILCAHTIVTLTFDDSYSDTLAAAPMLEAHGMRGVFYINSPRLTRGSRFMTVQDALSLQAGGHEIGGHTLHHPHLPMLAVEQQAVEICNDRTALIGMGLDVRHFAYPFGEASSDTEKAAEMCNYDSARGVGDLRDASGNAVTSEAYAPPSLYRIRANSSIRDENTLEQMQTRVVAGEDGGGGWVIINMHHVCDTCGTNQVHPAILSAFLDWLAPRTAQGTYVRTVRRMIKGELKPAVNADGSPAPDTTTGQIDL